jgi:hypothetical protein
MDESSKETSGERQSQEPEAAKLTNEKPADEAGGKTSPSDAPPDDAASADAQSAGAKAAHVPAVSGEHLPQVPAHGAAADGALPVVWSPSLGDDEVNAEEILRSSADGQTDTDGEAGADATAASAGGAAAAFVALCHGGCGACRRGGDRVVHRFALGDGGRAFLAGCCDEPGSRAHRLHNKDRAG